METKTIQDKGQTIALIVYKEIKAEGVRFLTPVDYPLQLGLIEHPAGKIIKDHIHRQDIKYKVDTTQEFLYIEKGRVKVKIFSDTWKVLEEVVLSKGDFVLFVGGGHGLEVLEACRIVEIKQGPYPGDKLCKIFREEASEHN